MNDYYPFGLSTANSWTRENTTGNNFLYNGGTELNTTTQVYDLHYRNYDPVLGRMNQVDPMASAYASATPYNYAFNAPTNMNDPFGDDPKDPKNTPKPTGAGGNANGGCSWCSPQDTGNGMGGFGNGSQLFSRSNAFFSPGWQPGSGSLSAGAFSRMTASYNERRQQEKEKSDKVNAVVDFFVELWAAATNTVLRKVDVKYNPSDGFRGEAYSNTAWLQERIDETFPSEIEKTPSTIWNVDFGVMGGFNYKAVRAEATLFAVEGWTNNPKDKRDGKVNLSNSAAIGVKINSQVNLQFEAGIEQKIKKSSLYSSPADFFKTLSFNAMGFQLGGKTDVAGNSVTSLDQTSSFSLGIIRISWTTPISLPK